MSDVSAQKPHHAIVFSPVFVFRSLFYAVWQLRHFFWCLVLTTLTSEVI